LEKLGLNLGYIFVQIFNFLVLFVVLVKWVYQPILNLLEKRRAAIAQGLEDARIAAEARENAENEAARIITEAQAKAAHIVNQASERADQTMVELKTQAEHDIEKERKGALADLQEERNRVLGDLRGQVAALAIAAANKLIGEALDEKKQHALIDDFFSGVKSGKVVVLDNADFKGDSAEVTSALPLDDKEQEMIKKSVSDKVGAAAVIFHVDPSILGGLVIRVGDKVLDDSVAGKLEGLRQALK
jgi:F-type H+-transporting ATPase subunit b